MELYRTLRWIFTDPAHKWERGNLIMIAVGIEALLVTAAMSLR